MPKSHRKTSPEQPRPAPSGLVPPGFFERHGGLVVGFLMALFCSLYLVICVVKFRYYLYNDFDMAMDAHAAWMMVRGSFYNSIVGVHYFGNHMRLLMVLLAPIYAVFPSCATLLVIQVVGVAFGALPVWWLARRELRNGFAAVCFAALYLLYPALGYVCLYEFHPEALTITTLLFTFYFLWVGRWRWMAVTAVLSLLGKEDVAVVVLAMAVYALALRRPRRWTYAAILATLAVASLVLSFVVVMPPLNQGKVGLESIYARWGETTGQALVGMARHPLRAVHALVATPGDPLDTRLKLEYYVQILGPVMLLPLLSPPALALALPAVAQHLLSARITEHTVVYHYTTHVIPFVILASVLGLRNLVGWLAGRRKVDGAPRARGRAWSLPVVLAVSAVGISLVCNGLFGPVWGRGILQSHRISEPTWPTSRDRTLAGYMDQMVARVPARAAIAADFRVQPRLCNRRDIHSLHHILQGTYTLSDQPYPVPDDVTAVLADLDEGRLFSFEPQDSGRRMQEFLAKNRLQPADAASSVVLWLRDATDPLTLFEPDAPAPAHPRRVEYDDQLAFAGNEEVPASVESGQRLTLRTSWQRLGAVGRLHQAQFFLINEAGNSVFAVSHQIGYGVWPPQEWPRGNTVRETFRLVVPSDVPPGTYRVGFRLLELSGTSMQVSTTADEETRRHQGVVLLGSVRVAG
jgi:uncharacterized membrane protein